MTGRTLEVVCFDRVAGVLTDAPGGMSFAYDHTWVAQGRPPLSQSLPLEGAFTTERVRAFFGGLLPEGPPRELLARQLGVSSGNDFGLLERLGGDTAGAVSLLRPGEPLPGLVPAQRVQWLTEDQLAAPSASPATVSTRPRAARGSATASPCCAARWRSPRARPPSCSTTSR